MTVISKLHRVSVDQTRPLRRKILRPHQDPSELAYPGDDWEESAHFALFARDRIVGVASVYPMGRDGERSLDQWRLRGMATDPEVRGTGGGRILFEATRDHARSARGSVYWCNARTTAIGFYQRMGMNTVGDEFCPPGLGPHFVMELKLHH